jgi:integrase
MSQFTPQAFEGKSVDVPKPPYPEFPLTAHASGMWKRKIAGRTYYFGRWANRVGGKLVRIKGDGWKKALADYKNRIDDIHSGRDHKRTPDETAVSNDDAGDPTVRAICNAFLTSKGRQYDAGEISPRMYSPGTPPQEGERPKPTGEYPTATKFLVDAFGKDRRVSELRPADFASLRATLARRYGPIRLGNTISRIRSVFKYGLDNGLIAKPILYGSEFNKPKKSDLRRHRAKRGERLILAAEIRAMLDVATPQFKAMILLGINAGFGNTDCAMLTTRAVDFKSGVVAFPRPKTGIARRCILWPETLDALRTAIDQRPKPKSATDDGLVFLTARGKPWIRTHAATAADNPRVDAVGKAFIKFKAKAGVDREGVGFYSLRHTFRTVADATLDTSAARLIMGHADHSIDNEYRDLASINDTRLKRVSDHVRAWLFADESKEAYRAS